MATDRNIILAIDVTETTMLAASRWLIAQHVTRLYALRFGGNALRLGDGSVFQFDHCVGAPSNASGPAKPKSSSSGVIRRVEGMAAFRLR